MTQDDLAAAVGRNRITIARVESGKPISRAVLLAIAEALGMDRTKLPGLEDAGEGILVQDREVAVLRAAPRIPMGVRRTVSVPLFRREGFTNEARGYPVCVLELPAAFFSAGVGHSHDRRRLMAVEVTNQSLSPELVIGDIAIVEEGADIGDGFGFFLHAGGTAFKRQEAALGLQPVGRVIAVLHKV